MIENQTIDYPHKSIALFITTLASFLTAFMGAAINIALPAIGTELQMTAIGLSWVATAYILSAAMFLVPLGKLADISGRKKIYTIGIIGYILFSFTSAIATTSTMLIISRALQGIGGAMLFGTGVAILISIYPPGDRGRVIGINVAAVYLGLSLGPFLGGILTQQFGWRSIFYINVPLGLLVLILILWKLKGEWAEAQHERFDIIGSIIYGLMLISIMYGLSKLPASVAIILVLVGIMGFIGFIVWEKRMVHPLLDIQLFITNRVFAFSNLAALINYSATFAVGFLLSLYLQYIKGLTPQNAGLVLVSQPIMQAIFSPIAGKMSDKIEPRIVASIGMAFTVIGLMLLILITATTSILYIVFSLIVLGFGFGLFSSPNTNAVMGAVNKSVYSVASATLGTMRLIGMMLSMGISTLIFSVYIGNVPLSPAAYPMLMISIRIALIIFALLCFAGVFASLMRGKLR
ncbi:MAG: MFS transporter [bacterium]